MGMPSSSIDPEVGGIRPVSMRMVVDFPAPFGPRNPKKQPRGTVEVQAVDRGLAPVDLAEIADFNRRRQTVHAVSS